MDKCDTTPLQVACIRDSAETKSLIKAGAKSNHVNSFGQSVLDYCGFHTRQIIYRANWDRMLALYAIFVSKLPPYVFIDICWLLRLTNVSDHCRDKQIVSAFQNVRDFYDQKQHQSMQNKKRAHLFWQKFFCVEQHFL